MQSRFIQVVLMGLAAVCSSPLSAALIGTEWRTAGVANIYTIDPVARTATLIGPTGIQALIGLVVDTDSKIYAISEEADSGLWLLNATTGAGTLIGRLGFNFQEGEMTIDPVTGAIYAAKGNGDQLYTVNKSTGAATLVGGFGSSGRDVSGLQFFDGVLYGLALNDGAGDTLVRVNPATGLATLVGPTGTNFGAIAGMGRDPVTGLVYIAGPTTNFGSDNTIWTLNLLTGVATNDGALSGLVASLSGFSVAGNPVILTPITPSEPSNTPEPAAVSMMALGLLAMTVLAGRQRRR